MLQENCQKIKKKIMVDYNKRSICIIKLEMISKSRKKLHIVYISSDILYVEYIKIKNPHLKGK